MDVFRNKVALVTGAASGIGRALIEKLQRQGATVVGIDRHFDPADRPPGESVELDVRDRDAFERLASRLRREHGHIDLLINNAGIGVGGEVRDYQYDDWRSVIEVNLFGVIHGIDAIYPSMVARGSGQIVNVASVAGLVPLPGEASYTASKFAVVGMSLALRSEAADLGVRVSAACPGKVDTPIYETSPVRGFDKEKVLALLPKGMSAARCAEDILNGARKDRAIIVSSAFARALWLAQRVSPVAMAWSATRYMREMRRYREA